MSRQPVILRTIMAVSLCFFGVAIYYSLLSGTTVWNQGTLSDLLTNAIGNATGDIASSSPPSKYGPMTMMLRFSSTPRLKHQFFCMFLRTQVLFWPPSYGKLVIILDDENKGDHAFGDKLKKLMAKHLPNITFEVCYEPLPTKNILSFKGSPRGAPYNRQLWSTFFPDNYTKDSIVAYMDTDTLFVTPMTRKYIGLPEGKLKVFGEGTFKPWVHSWNKSTEIGLGLPLIANFMITFPQFVYVDTYVNCRKFIMKRLKTDDFEVAFSKMYAPGTMMSGICTCLTYAWFYEHDRYEWHIKTHEADASFNNAPLPAGKKITPKETIPSIVGVGHISNFKAWQPDIVLPGYCMSTKAAGIAAKGCEKVEHDMNLLCDYFEAFFRYPWPTAKTWCKAGTMQACCREAMVEHYKDVTVMYKEKLLDFDKNLLYSVDKLAKDDGVTCPHIDLP